VQRSASPNPATSQQLSQIRSKKKARGSIRFVDLLKSLVALYGDAEDSRLNCLLYISASQWPSCQPGQPGQLVNRKNLYQGFTPTSVNSRGT